MEQADKDHAGNEDHADIDDQRSIHQHEDRHHQHREAEHHSRQRSQQLVLDADQTQTKRNADTGNRDKTEILQQKISRDTEMNFSLISIPSLKPFRDIESNIVAHAAHDQKAQNEDVSDHVFPALGSRSLLCGHFTITGFMGVEARVFASESSKA